MMCYQTISRQSSQQEVISIVSCCDDLENIMIYFVKQKNYVKIGCTDDLEQRLKTL